MTTRPERDDTGSKALVRRQKLIDRIVHLRTTQKRNDVASQATSLILDAISRDPRLALVRRYAQRAGTNFVVERQQQWVRKYAKSERLEE